MVDMTTHGTGIGYYVENGQNITDTSDGIMITSDFNLLDIDFYLEYRVSDPVAYLYASDDPEEILKNIALSSIRSIVADYTVDEQTFQRAVREAEAFLLEKHLLPNTLLIPIQNRDVSSAHKPEPNK